MKACNRGAWKKHCEKEHKHPCLHYEVCGAMFLRKRDRQLHLKSNCIGVINKKTNIPQYVLPETDSLLPQTNIENIEIENKEHDMLCVGLYDKTPTNIDHPLRKAKEIVT